MLGNAGSNRTYREIGVAEGHHRLSHHGGSAEKQRDIRKINRLHVSLLATLLGALDRARTTASGAERRLLDDAIVFYGSGLADGNRHNHDDLPALLAGGGGRIQTGRHLRLKRDTPMANLYLALIRQAGLDVRSFGDSTGALLGS